MRILLIDRVVFEEYFYTQGLKRLVPKTWSLPSDRDTV